MELRFHEVMDGVFTKAGERFDRPFRFDFAVSVPHPERAAYGVARGKLTGTVTLDGFAKEAPAEGTLELSPFVRRQLRYAFHFDVDGARHRFEGKKTLGLRHPVADWTTLPGAVFDAEGHELGKATLRFHLRRDFLDLLTSLRLAHGDCHGRCG